MPNITCPHCGREFSLEDKPVLEQYSPPAQTGVKKAEPKLSVYREKFKNRTLSPLEVTARPSIAKISKVDADLDRFSFRGEGLFFGPGIEQEL